MRYHYEPPENYRNCYGITYKCDHPVYNQCTLYLINNCGLAVIQQRYNPKNKTTFWTEIDPALVDALYLTDGFYDYFKKKSKKISEDQLYPTVTVRQLMWALKLKPLKREPWETTFDKSGF